MKAGASDAWPGLTPAAAQPSSNASGDAFRLLFTFLNAGRQRIPEAAVRDDLEAPRGPGASPTARRGAPPAKDRRVPARKPGRQSGTRRVGAAYRTPQGCRRDSSKFWRFPADARLGGAAARAGHGRRAVPSGTVVARSGSDFRVSALRDGTSIRFHLGHDRRRLPGMDAGETGRDRGGPVTGPRCEPAA